MPVKLAARGLHVIVVCNVYYVATVFNGPSFSVAGSVADSLIPSIDASILFDPDHQDYQKAIASVRFAATEVGFMTIYNTVITRSQVETLLAEYREFFLLPEATKSAVDMAKTNSNRGWGRSGAERVSAKANPDYKQVFDSGPELDASDPLTSMPFYATNRWPHEPMYFRDSVVEYYQQACSVALNLLSVIAIAIGENAHYFNDAFDKPMALLRGNYYPVRPDRATTKDFGIAEHTDYGCLTLLATDGAPGLEVKVSDDTWLPVCVPPGEFVINFGEMLEFWTDGKVLATPHRVHGGKRERMSVPLFFNPRHDVNVAPAGTSQTILAGDHLSKRYNETYLHLNDSKRD